jgi:CTP:molybdopterin cytidylyltransferase MocA
VTKSLPILIMAAGASSRMRGRDKLAECVDGVPLLTRQARAALSVSPTVFVALPGPDHPRAALLTGLGVTILSAPDAAEGLGGSLRNAVARLPPGPSFMIFLSDLPEITANDLQTLITAREDNPGYLVWRGATDDGQPGHPILLDQSLRAGFATLSGDSGGDSILRPLRDRTMLVPLPGHRARRDLDTPEDWAAWRAGTGR